jgi:peptidoglycan/LPS O-acetylase OafA/YrhL
MVDASSFPAPEAIDEGSDDSTGSEPSRRWGRWRRTSEHAAVEARPRHFPCFDGLRAIAAILVILVHTGFESGFTLRSSAGIYTARFEIGVSVFFLISGFLLYRPFAASHIAGGEPPAVGKFWVRRFLRIVPAYWLAFAVTNYVMHIDTPIRHGFGSLLISLGLLQVYFPSHALTGITQAWSLCTELSFYLFLPLFAVIVARGGRSDRPQLRRELVALAGLFATGLGVRFWLLHMHSNLAYFALEWLPACLDLFALGMLLAVLSSWLAHRHSEPRWLWHPLMPWISWGLALVMLWAVAHLGVSLKPLDRNPPGRGMAQELLYSSFAFFLLVPAVFGPQRSGVIRWVLRCKPVAALGVVSYGIYLWHQAWIGEFVKWTGELFRVPLPEMFAVVLGLSVASASASYLLVERPILGLKDRLGWWNRTARPATVSVPAPARTEEVDPAT